MKLVPGLLALLFAPALINASAFAAPAEDHWTIEPSAAESEAFQQAAKLIEAEDYAAALPVLQRLAPEMPDNADVYNLLGFAYRKTGDLDQSAAAYERALFLQPDHLGALEYQGELFLTLGDLKSAEANLARLALLCASPCEERDDLADAIAEAIAARRVKPVE